MNKLHSVTTSLRLQVHELWLLPKIKNIYNDNEVEFAFTSNLVIKSSIFVWFSLSLIFCVCCAIPLRLVRRGGGQTQTVAVPGRSQNGTQQPFWPPHTTIKTSKQEKKSSRFLFSRSPSDHYCWWLIKASRPQIYLLLFAFCTTFSLLKTNWFPIHLSAHSAPSFEMW